jgi:short-subunit dehydrogenase involved in D-alanine esterification of teichoic acids
LQLSHRDPCSGDLFIELILKRSNQLWSSLLVAHLHNDLRIVCLRRFRSDGKPETWSTAANETRLITGRDQSKMHRAKAALPNIHTFLSDVSDPNAIATLYEQVTKQFPELNILINNAGIMREINVHDKAGSLEDITREIEINLSGPIRMVKQFLPHLKTKSEAAIMNVSSGLAFVPLVISPVYCATTASSRHRLEYWHL